MKIYRSKETGATFYAEMPSANTSLDFIHEAALYDIFIFKFSSFDPYTVDRWNEPFYYFKQNITDVKITERCYLLLPTDPSIRKTYGKGAFLTCFDNFFTEKYEPIDTEQEPEMPSKKLAGKSFYLDAGHGGKDSGAVNNNFGLMEKIAALDVCLKLGELLEAQGARIYYSRTGDTYPSLTVRASEANSRDVTAFISIHLNSADNKSASGIETLVYSLKGTAYDLAEKVQKNMVAATGWKDRGVKERPGLTVLKKTKMPAILCEIGFISNDEQAVALFTPQMQDAIARAIADGVIEQFGK